VIDVDPYYNDKSNPDGSGINWYINQVRAVPKSLSFSNVVQSNFFRQIRNFVIDISATTLDHAAGLHYQVAQATSLQNIEFVQSTDPNTTQRGICKSFMVSR
jgi:glucan 1,3-beta-glucosidase